MSLFLALLLIESLLIELLRLLIGYYFLGSTSTQFLLENIKIISSYIPVELINFLIIIPFSISLFRAIFLTIAVWGHSLTVKSDNKEEQKKIRQAFFKAAIFAMPFSLIPFPFGIVSIIIYSFLLSKQIKKITEKKYSIILTLLVIPFISLIIMLIAIISFFLLWLFW